MNACQEMFSLQTEENAEYMGAAPMAPVSLGTALSSPMNRNYVKIFTHPDFHCPKNPAKLRRGNDYLVTHCCLTIFTQANILFFALKIHDKIASFSEKMLPSTTTRTRSLMLELTPAISKSLGLDNDRIAKALNIQDCIQFLVWNQYPVAA